MVQTNEVFEAIADQTRREIIDLVAVNEMNVNSIAGHFSMTRQAVSLHIKILEGAGLLQIEKQGRERFCKARLERLDQVGNWINRHRKFWEEKFSSLEKYIDQENSNPAND